MPVLVERQRISRRKLLLLRPYILWRRNKDIAATKQIISDIKREEEEKERAIEHERKVKEDKKRRELQDALDRAKEIHSELTAVRLHREGLEEKLKLLHEEKHRLFVCLKTLLTPKDNQRKSKPLKDQVPPQHIPVDRVHVMTFPSSAVHGKFTGDSFQRGKMEQGIHPGSSLKRPHSPTQSTAIPYPYMEQTPSLQAPYASLQHFYSRGTPPTHPEQSFIDVQGGNRPDYETHRRIQLQRQDYGRPWQQSSHKSPSASDRRGHSSRQNYPNQGPAYPNTSYTYSKSTSQQRKSGPKH